jgi:HAD superfamily hydrolase (TIGR01509 family)
MTDTHYRAAVLLDLDGTLVDSNYLHIATWQQALRAAGHDVPAWRIHRGIGMGSQRLIPWLLGRHVEEHQQLSDEHHRLFLGHAETLRPTRGALALLDDLERRKVPFTIATSAKPEIRKALLSALGRQDLSSTDAGEVPSPKPAPDLLLAACEELGANPEHTTLVGDSPWDAEAADQVGVRMIGVRCGGFGPEELLDAGALDVVDAPGDLVGRL